MQEQEAETASLRGARLPTRLNHNIQWGEGGGEGKEKVEMKSESSMRAPSPPPARSTHTTLAVHGGRGVGGREVGSGGLGGLVEKEPRMAPLGLRI